MRLRRQRWQHPELQPGWIERPHQVLALGDLPLESGEPIRDFEISYVTHGTRAGDNVVLVLTAIGSTHHRLDFLVGPGRPLDPEHHFIICADAIGNGLSTSPSNSEAQPDLSFPRFSIRDMVASQRKLLDALGVERLASIVGASMGGMQALQWGVSHPDCMRSIVALVPMARTRPWSVAMNEVARRILRADPGYPSGPYGSGIEAWAALTRVITNREPRALEGVAAAAVPGLVDQVVETARGVASDPLDWIYQSWAYDAHDVGTTPGFDGDTAAALRTIKTPTLLLVPALDLYNPVDDAIEAARSIPDATLVRLDGNAGHAVAADASPQLDEIRGAIGEFLIGHAC
ncbi:alpha/beta fold hydrolase [Bradyrhizobium cenepequi]|uniref:alpha/beta fold hydrolase n=1 Tax=Bradyrhizobium cenepequi TaxID=2821403 RepID=UPI001CE24D82|nr:alpha/beta fold hydrolase [Bradyrhizobium cenepequi]MCA6111120.1 alpha/beta fold hydrolase [Bradyrhizobium cenepequi]